MSAGKTDFVAWATDPARTSDELFTIERLIERSRVWNEWPFHERDERFDERLETMKARKFNPAYRPTLPRDELAYLSLHPDKPTHFSGYGTGDRQLRDIQALRFFPALQDVELNSSDISDLSPLEPLLKIKRLSIGEYGDIGGHQPLDFSQCGEMPELEHLGLSLRHAWPNLRSLANWIALRDLHFSGNILALADVVSLPALESAQLHKWVNNETPLPDLLRFPAMPKIQRLSLQNTSSLNGIDRYPTLLNLEIGGEFRDLKPLLTLENLTYLKLTGEFFSDLTPLTRMPKLREIVFVRECPLDLSVLAEAPQLRRVDFERCAIVRTELGALNAALIPEENDFLAETPRPLQPLKLYRKTRGNGSSILRRLHEETRAERERFFGGDAAFAHAELRSATQTLQRRLDLLLGRGWGLWERHQGKGGHAILEFKRYQDTIRIREIIQLLRQFSAESRFPWSYLINVEPHGDMSYELEQLRELDEEAKEPEGHWLKKHLQPEQALEENEDIARHYEQKYQLLEREHLYRLQQQQGGELDPRLSQPPAEPAVPVEEPAEEEEKEEPFTSSANEEDDEGGAVAIAPPPPPPPGTQSLGEELSFYLQLFENCAVINNNAERASYALGMEAVELSEEPPAEEQSTAPGQL